MTNSVFYIDRSKKNSSYACTWQHEVHPKHWIELYDHYEGDPAITVKCPKIADYRLRIPRTDKYRTYVEMPEEVFAKNYLESYKAIQRLPLEDIECFLNVGEPRDNLMFRAFIPKKRTQLIVSVQNSLEECSLSVDFGDAGYRLRSARIHDKPIQKAVFLQAFTLAMDCLYFRESVGESLLSTITQISTLVDVEEPGEVITFNPRRYCSVVRDEMLNRKKELEARLITLDEVPAKRREVRAEIRGIEYCIKVLDGNR